VGPRKHVLNRDAHWRNLVNTIEPSVCGGDAALCQLTFITCYYYYYVTVVADDFDDNGVEISILLFYYFCSA